MSIIRRIGFWTLLALFQGVHSPSPAIGADGDLYFPHFTHGGPAEARWETVFTFTNNTSRQASSTLEFLDDLGSELMLDFGFGLTKQIDFAVPANGSHFIEAAASTGESVSGWVRARSSVPVQATAHYRLFSRDTLIAEIAADAVWPMSGYSASATAWTGIALVNPSAFRTVSVRMNVLDMNNGPAGEAMISIPPLRHMASNLQSMVPVPPDFAGLIDLESDTGEFLAWTVASDGASVSQNDGSPRYGSVLWSSGFETGDNSEWYAPSASATGDYGGGEFNSGTVGSVATREVSHSGSWAFKMTIDTSRESGVRMFRWREPQTIEQLRYSAWLYFPRRYDVHEYWNIFQWKSKTPDGRNDPFFVLNVGNRPDGSMFFYAYDWQRKHSYSQQVVNLPVGKWFKVEAYYNCAGDEAGHVTFWQDGKLLFDIPEVQTRYPDGDCQWSVNNYSNGLVPSVATIYLDDASIAHGNR